MKYLNLVLVVMATLLFSSCSHTYLTSTWHDVERKPATYEKIAVVALAHSKANRGVIENAIATEFKENGYHTISTMGIFPKAGDPNATEGIDQEEIQRVVKEKVEKNNIDALMIITLLDKDKSEHYVEGSVSTYAGTPYYGGYGSPYSYPMNSFAYGGYGYAGYYAHAYSTVYSPGYYYETTSYFIETSLFDVASGSMIWSGQSKTTDPVSITREAETFASVILEGIFRDRALEVLTPSK